MRPFLTEYGLLGAPEGVGCMDLRSLEVERFVDRVFFGNPDLIFSAWCSLRVWM